MHRLSLISTGGTLEKVYSETDGEVKNIQSKLGVYLQRLRLPYLQIQHHTLMNIDSLFMTEVHRQMILEKVIQLQDHSNSVVITHGTDTMTVTGEYLKSKMTPKVPVVFTGAMVPLGFENGDGLQNLTESLISAQILPPDFYVVFHGCVFKIGKVRKNREKACFEQIESPS